MMLIYGWIILEIRKGNTRMKFSPMPETSEKKNYNYHKGPKDCDDNVFSNDLPSRGEKIIVYPGTTRDFVVNVGNQVFFDENSTELTANEQASLDKQAQWLVRFSHFAITIEGHDDEVGTGPDGSTFGSLRAESVAQYLINHGVSKSRISTISFGAEKRLATCDDISCQAQNRCAVTMLNRR